MPGGSGRVRACTWTQEAALGPHADGAGGVVAAALAWVIKPFLAQRWAAAELAGRGYALALEPSWLSRLTGQAVFDRVVEADTANLDRVSRDGRSGYLDPLTVEDVVCLEFLQAPREKTLTSWAVPR